MEKLLKQYQGYIINIDEHYNVTNIIQCRNYIEEEKNIKAKIIDLNELNENFLKMN